MVDKGSQLEQIDSLQVTSGAADDLWQLILCGADVRAAACHCRGLRTGEQLKTIQMLQSEGVTVEVSTLDVAVRAEAQQLMADSARLAPVGGIFHLAMILSDRLILKHVSLPGLLPCQPLCLSVLGPCSA